MKAIFSLYAHQSFCCQIPTRDERKWLNCCFCGHNPTKAQEVAFSRFKEQYDDLLPHLISVCDLDGYLSIEIHNSKDAKDCSKYWNEVEAIKKALEATFPQITEWEEVSFSDIVNI